MRQTTLNTSTWKRILLSQFLSMLIQDCAPFWHELWHPVQAVHVALTRGLKNILFLHHVSNIFQELFDLQGNMHVKGCPETYSRIRCHVLLRLLVYVRMMLLCAKKKKKKHPQMCVCWDHIVLSHICVIEYLRMSHLDDAVSNLSCANEWHSDSFEGLC